MEGFLSNRIVVNVSTGPHYLKGQERLTEWLAQHGEEYTIWNDRKGLPVGISRRRTRKRTTRLRRSLAERSGGQWQAQGGKASSRYFPFSGAI